MTTQSACATLFMCLLQKCHDRGISAGQQNTSSESVNQNTISAEYFRAQYRLFVDTTVAALEKRYNQDVRLAGNSFYRTN